MVKDLSCAFGYPLFTVVCSPSTDHKGLMNRVKGAVATGTAFIMIHVTLVIKKPDFFVVVCYV